VFELPFSQPEPAHRRSTWRLAAQHLPDASVRRTFSAFRVPIPVERNSSRIDSSCESEYDAGRVANVDRGTFACRCGTVAPATASNPIGNMGRNVLRSSPYRNIDVGIIKNTRFPNHRTCKFAQNLQLTIAAISGCLTAHDSANFLNQWEQMEATGASSWVCGISFERTQFRN